MADNTSQHWVIETTGYGHRPRICVDRGGRWWISWISSQPDREKVCLAWRVPGRDWSTAIELEDTVGRILELELAPWQDGVLIAWVDDGEPAGGLKMRGMTVNASSPVVHFVGRNRAPAHLSLCTRNHRFAVCWSTGESVKRSLSACLGIDLLAEQSKVSVCRRGGWHIHPAVTLLDNGALIAWQAVVRGHSAICARRIDGSGELSEIWQISPEGKGIHAKPALCRSAEGGAWIAWHSDVDPQQGPQLVRWIELAHCDRAGTIRYPEMPLPDVERDGTGEDQGFEFPRLAQLPDERLVIIGRGSQSFQRQDLGSEGFSARQQIDEERWACRGSRLSVWAVDDGVLFAARERNGIVVRRLPAGQRDRSDRPRLGPPGEPTRWHSVFPVVPPRTHEINGQRVLFGDLHLHTAESDGTGTIEEAYHRARHRYEDDFIAVADHESFLGKQTPPGAWSTTRRIADEFNEPGWFVTLLAFEWTGSMYPGPGHKVVYLPPDGGPLLSREDQRYGSSAQLIAECARLGALVFPHHVGWTGADMVHHDPAVQTCWEIVSCHGAYERQDNLPIRTRGDDKPEQFIADALDRGLRFGFVGGSDGHGLNWHHGVCRVQDSHRSGLTGIFAPAATRQQLLDALHRRRCFATSGAKIALWFEVEGCPMGEEIATAGPVPFRVLVKGTAPIAELSLVTNGNKEIPLKANGDWAEINGTLPPPPACGWAYYFVRVVQTDEQVAWSSPIWLDAPDPA